MNAASRAPKSSERPLRVAIVGSGLAGFYVALALRKQQAVQTEVATGNDDSQRLGIPGAGVTRCTPAAVVAGWYNGHLDDVDAPFDFSRRVAVVGHGKMAIDLARIPAKDAGEPTRTSIASHGLDALAESAVEELSSAVPFVDATERDESSAAELKRARRQVRRNPLPSAEAPTRLLAEGGVTFDDRQRLEAVEPARAQRRATRDTLTDVDEMLAVAHDSDPTHSPYGDDAPSPAEMS